MASSISGISSLSMNPVRPISASSVSPQNFSVENESEVSDAFSESLAVNGTDGITGPAPVQYANASRTRTDEAALENARSATEVNDYYNKVASSFEGASTSYDAGGNASGYAMVGSHIDLLA